jgi:signal transduction histidine kinase/DNA-binding NarL/FixJ family response regulator
MRAVSPMSVDESIEHRYLAILRLGASLARAGDWTQVATAVAESLAPVNEHRPARLWGRTAEGYEVLGDSGHAFPRVAARALHQAADRDEPAARADGGVLVGLHAGGVSVGVLEVRDIGDDSDFAALAAPIVACRVALLAAQGIGEAILSPLPVDAASDASTVVSAFAAEAKRMLDHDRLSAYLLSDDGRMFERFAVATSPILPGEGVIIPFEDVGLRSIVIANRALVSEDLGRDARIVGREDRVIAAAGFRGLLSVPLRLGGRPIGVLNFVSRTAGFYREQDVPVAQQIADQISVFLENLRRQRGMRAAIQQEATQRERARLTRDLYHTVSEAALSIGTAAEALRDRLAGVDAEAARQAQRIAELTRLELADVRRAVIDLSPRALDTHSLAEVVESTLARIRPDEGLEVTLRTAGDTSTLPRGVARVAYRIVQEALANVRLHAHAAHLHVELISHADLELVLRDDGVGFDTCAPASQAGLGLRGMRERAQSLGGTIAVESGPGAGTTVRFRLPLSREPRQPPPVPDADGDRPRTGVLRVLVADVHPVARAGLSAMLERAGGIRVIGQVATEEELAASVPRLRPDVLLVDGHVASGRPVDLVRRLSRASPNSRMLLVLSGASAWHPDLLDAGAAGSVHKDIDAAGLADAVRAAAAGATVVMSTPRGGESAHATLSVRELEILALIAAGQTNTEIGDALYLATKTVERQVATIAAKLGARNRAHAAAIAVADRLVDLADDCGTPD